MKLTRHSRLTFLSFAAVISLGVLSSVPAQALKSEPSDPDQTGAVEPPPGQTWEDVRANEQLSNLLHEIGNIEEGSGASAIIPDKKAKTVSVFWTVPIPDQVAALDNQEEVGYTINVEEARVSVEQAVSAGTKLLAESKGTGPRPTFITVSNDGASVDVSYLTSDIEKYGREELRQHAESVTGLPVAVQQGDEFFPTSRWNDSSPWYGGGALFRTTPTGTPIDCSTGFSTTTSSGAGRMLTARHCNPPAGAAWEDGAGDPFSSAGSAQQQLYNDTLLIDPIGATGGSVHGGPWNASSSHPRYHLKVAGAQRATYGEDLCTSGSMTGEHCGLEVITSYGVGDCPGGSGTCSGFQASNIDGSTSAVSNGTGDSGGPVYLFRSDGRVGARGLIDAAAIVVPCGSTAKSGVTCGHKVFFTDIIDVKNQWNVDVQVSP